MASVSADEIPNEEESNRLQHSNKSWYTELFENADASSLWVRHGLIALLAIIFSLSVTGNTIVLWEWMILPSWRFALTVIGTSIGVGLGLGLAAHVHDRLEVWHSEETKSSTSPKLHQVTSMKSTSRSAWEEETTYASLMASAGYDASDRVHRAQVMRKSSDFFQPFYPFTNVEPSKQRGPQIMAQQWPHLPKAVSFELGCFIELVVRDYVASWYSIIDKGCPYENEREKRAKQKETEDGTTNGEVNEQSAAGLLLENFPRSRLSDRTMVWTTVGHRPMPLLHTMYHSLAIIFGNLSSRVEHVNVFSLILLRWIKVLGHTFKAYRQLRRSALQKSALSSLPIKSRGKLNNRSPRKTLNRANSAPMGGVPMPSPSTERATRTSSMEMDAAVTQSVPPAAARRLDFAEQQQQPEMPRSSSSKAKREFIPVSEMTMAKEFLLAGKLHRAVTFGLDVPSLLFADTKGKECGVGSNELDPSQDLTEEQVLEKRLFETNILSECELDYNRVLAHRLCRALLPRSEFSSPIIRTLFTELFAGCVLTPAMGCFAPVFVNEWICQGIDSMSAASEQEEENADNSDDEYMNGDMLETDDDIVGVESGIETVDSETNLDVVGDNVIRVKTSLDLDESEEQGERLQQGNNEQQEAQEGDQKGATTDNNGGTEDDEVAMASDVSIACSDDLEHDAAIVKSSSYLDRLSSGEDILTLTSIALTDLERHVNFEDSRRARFGQGEVVVDWDDPACRECVRQLVLVIEGALLHGCRAKRKSRPPTKGRPSFTLDEEGKDPFNDEIDENEGAVEVSMHEHQSSSLSNVLMELTSDIEAFEDRVVEEEKELQASSESSLVSIDEESDDDDYIVHKPSKTEISTLRTLIAAWLHTGQIYHIVSVISKAHHSILDPFYHSHAFLRNPDYAKDFVKKLKALEMVDILVDTMAILASSSLDIEENSNRLRGLSPEERQALLRNSISSTRSAESGEFTIETPRRSRSPSRMLAEQRRSLSQKAGSAVRRLTIGSGGTPNESPGGGSTTALLSQRYFGSSTPRYLDFEKNAAFASSLRLERERRSKSWADVTAVKEGEIPGIICRTKGATERDKVIHREIHNISRILYAGTNMLAIRHGARRKRSEDSHVSTDSSSPGESGHVSLLTVETASQRRRIEVPDDDSSFLLRAQARPLNPVGVHRDQRNSDQSFKSFYATYEEPAVLPGETRYRGGRYIRRCVLRYYPIDRTASISVPKDFRQLDHRDGGLGGDDGENSLESSTRPFLSSDFLRERHLCKKWYPKGSAPRSGSILTSSVMEATDFSAVPRTGRAIDFVYRMCLFERPMVDLGGKRFTVHDSTSAGVHRADASSLEMSDAALSVALLTIGDEWHDDIPAGEQNEDGDNQERNGARAQTNGTGRPKVEMGPDGYPIVWMKFSVSKQGDKSNVEVKPCRTSYVRAALLIASTRQSAQLQCLLRCVRAGSARNATKARTEALLWPTLKLLEFANGPMRDKQSILLRDLKLGINHIDREQLRRNGLLKPRAPTTIRTLMTVIEGAVQAKDAGVDLYGSSPTSILFKIRCVAIVELETIGDEEEEMQYFPVDDDHNTGLFREEWVVYRSFREFTQLHKHLKTQVSVSEASVSAGARLVGAATAAFTVTGASNTPQRHRMAMIPSLGQAKAGALGATRKTIQKRRAVLGAYLKHLTSPNHLMNRCPELMLFLGAFYPFPPEVQTGGEEVRNVRDSLGRTFMSRTMLQPQTKVEDRTESTRLSKSISDDDHGSSDIGEEQTPEQSLRSVRSDASNTSAAPPRSSVIQTPVTTATKQGTRDNSPKHRRRSRKIVMKPAIKAKIDQVRLAEVRSCIFEFVRHIFDFDNASFFRSRIFSAMKTMSFAVTTSSEFRKKLYETHVKQLNPDSVAYWIRYGIDMLWPDGVFFETKPPPTPEECKESAKKAKGKLPTAFPDQLRTVLGQEITQNTFDILHEMLQNRLVLKSMAYMLFDLLWLEIFPELQDFLTCGEALDIE